MKKILTYAALLAMPLWACAQQGSQSGSSMPAMPGMDTGERPQSNQPSPKSAPGQQSMPGIPGMNMPGIDMPAPTQPGNPAAQNQTQNEPQPQQQQNMPDMPGMQMTPGMQMNTLPSTNTQSLTRDAAHLQEPENPGYHTGQDMLAPDLLKDVVKRTPLGLSDFLAMADRENPILRQAADLAARSGEQARQAGLYPNPQAGYQGEQIRGGDYGGGEQGGYVQQTVVLGGKLGLRHNIYAQQQVSDRIGVEEQTYRVHNDVTQAFYTTLAAQALVIERQHLLRLTEDSVTTAHQLANVGQADAPDVLQSEVELGQAQIDLENAQRSLLQSFRTLAAYVNKPELAVSPLNGALDLPPELNPEQQIATMVAVSPTVKRAQQEVKIAEARLKDASREAVPDLLLRAGGEYNGETIALDPRKSVGAQSFASVGINIPMWNRNQGNIGAAKAEVERARLDVLRTQLQIRQQAEPLAQSYMSARFQAQRYRDELIPRARRAYELYLIKYQQMAEAYPQVLVSQRTLFQLQIAYVQSMQAVWTTSTALKNYDLHNSLQVPSSSGSSSTNINSPNGGSE